MSPGKPIRTRFLVNYPVKKRNKKKETKNKEKKKDNRNVKKTINSAWFPPSK